MPGLTQQVLVSSARGPTVGPMYATYTTADANRYVTNAGGATLYSRYSVRDSGGLSATNLINTVSGDNLLRVGSPSLTTIPNPTYGW